MFFFLYTHSVWACSKRTDSPDFCLRAWTESISIKTECAEQFVESPATGCQGCCGPIYLHCQLDKSDATGLLAYSHVKQSNSLCLLHHPSKCQLCHVALMKRVNSRPTLPLVVRDLLYNSKVDSVWLWKMFFRASMFSPSCGVLHWVVSMHESRSHWIKMECLAKVINGLSVLQSENPHQRDA